MMRKIYLLAIASILVVSANAQVVINEVYGGGGNAGATLKNDFVELVNRGNNTISVTGAYLQYASVNGNFSAGNILALPDFTLNPGQYYLIQLAHGNGGTQDLPAPDFVPAGTHAPHKPLALSGTGGKVALTGDATVITSATASNVLDFVGWGSANTFEGTGAAPATTNSTSIQRNATHDDTNDNSADFTRDAPSPMNSAGSTTPVTIKEFQVSREDKAVRLDWTTASEFNSKEFVVERSGGNKSWQAIGSVAAAGNSSVPLKYYYTDAKPLNGENFYRLKMVDLDGSFQYYLTKNININESFSLKIYPNPVKDILHVEAAGNGLNIAIYNASGIRVYAGALNGSPVDLSKLATGVYFVKVYNNEGETVTKKVVKL